MFSYISKICSPDMTSSNFTLFPNHLGWTSIPWTCQIRCSDFSCDLFLCIGSRYTLPWSRTVGVRGWIAGFCVCTNPYLGFNLAWISRLSVLDRHDRQRSYCRRCRIGLIRTPLLCPSILVGWKNSLCLLEWILWQSFVGKVPYS